MAVKLLKLPMENNGEVLITEVASISKTSHINIVELMGFCLEGYQRALTI